MLKRAGKLVGRHAFNLAHILIDIAVGIVVLVVLCSGALAWRLSRGPILLDVLTRPAISSFNKQSATQIRVEHSWLAWAGWRRSEEPVQLRLQQLVLFNQRNGQTIVLARLPQASVSLSLARLLLGQVRPRTIIVQDVALHATRDAAGNFTFDLGSMPSSPGPAPSPGALGLIGNQRGGVLTALTLLSLHGVRLDVTDQALGIAWSIDGADVDFSRKRRNWTGDARLPLSVGTLHDTITATIAIARDGSASFNATTTPLRPSDAALAIPALHSLAAIEAPMTIAASGRFDAHHKPLQWQIDAALGKGWLQIGNGLAPVADASISLQGTSDQAHITRLALDLPARNGAAISHFTGTGGASRGSNGVTGAVAIDLDQALFSDLPELWPFGIAPGARSWVTHRITDGTVRNAHVDMAFIAHSDFSNFFLTKLTGRLDGDDLTLTWLDNVPAITHAQTHLILLDRDTINIPISSGQQGPIAIKGGSFDIAAVTSAHPQGTLSLDTSGQLPDLLNLLAVPRLHLLSIHPLSFTNPTGGFTGHLGITLPLNSNVTMAQIRIIGVLHGTDVHLGQVAAGKDLDHGIMDVNVDNDGLGITGTGDYAQIPAQVVYKMDFRPGDASEVLQHVEASGTTTPAVLAADGYDPLGFLDSGKVPLHIIYDQRRDGMAKLSIDADLTPVSLTPQFGWSKPIGTKGEAHGTLAFEHAKLTDVPAFNAKADGKANGALDVDGSMGITPTGNIGAIALNHMQLGQNELSAQIAFPAAPADPYRIQITGNTIDLSGEFKHLTASNEPDHGPHYIIDANFARALMANKVQYDHVAAHVESDNGVIQAAQITAATANLAITRIGAIRHLHINSTDAGLLCDATDSLSDIKGGSATVNATYDDTLPLHPMRGTLSANKFSVRDAPAMTKLLQAITGYGLITMAATGPGLAITTMTSDFTYDPTALTLNNATAHSASIGFTAQGSFDLVHRSINLRGTIVPAYVFNNALSRLPLVGPLFSSNKGGGILVLGFTVHGPHDNPTVRVNPLSALTPGFLWGMFGNKK